MRGQTRTETMAKAFRVLEDGTAVRMITGDPGAATTTTAGAAEAQVTDGRGQAIQAVTVTASIPLSPQWRCALEMLADAGETGVPAATLLASGFSTEMLQSLELVGLAVRFAPQRAPMAPMHITNAGRLALCARKAPASAPGTPEETPARTVGPPDGTTRS